jgi:hypothetical protein
LHDRQAGGASIPDEGECAGIAGDKCGGTLMDSAGIFMCSVGPAIM